MRRSTYTDAQPEMPRQQSLESCPAHVRAEERRTVKNLTTADVKESHLRGYERLLRVRNEFSLLQNRIARPQSLSSYRNTGRSKKKRTFCFGPETATQVAHVSGHISRRFPFLALRISGGFSSSAVRFFFFGGAFGSFGFVCGATICVTLCESGGSSCGRKRNDR